MKKILFAIFVFCTFTVKASILSPINSDATDQEIYGNSTAKWVGQTTARIGYDNATTDGNAMIFVFALPTLSVGESISSASLDVFVNSMNYFGGVVWALDLYGIRTSNSNAVQTTDFFMGANDGSNTKIQDDFSVVNDSGLAGSTISSSAAGETALGSWLSSQYTGVNPNNTYAFLRLNADITTASMSVGRYYTINTGNNAGNNPALTITTAIPEPGTMALVLISLGGLLLFRRRS